MEVQVLAALGSLFGHDLFRLYIHFQVQMMPGYHLPSKGFRGYYQVPLLCMP